MLRNPIYAGCYVYGRSSTRELLVDGEPRRIRVEGNDASAWLVCIADRHPGYITWDRYLANREKLRENTNRFGAVVRGAPREGPSLLSGIVVCGRCGRRMHPAYGPLGTVRYQCTGERPTGGPGCWSLEGAPVDRLVEKLFLAAMVPQELELALAVEQQASEQADALTAQWRLRIERAEYEARLAERRYLAVDPDNRVVARTLEASWEERLRELERIRHGFEDARRDRRVDLTDADRTRIRALATDLAGVWRAATTEPEERQAMVRLVVEAVCLTPVDVPVRQTRVSIQWRSGAVTEQVVARAGRGDDRRTADDVIERLRELVAAGLRDEEVAERLNAEGIWPAADRPWTTSSASQARRRHQVPRVAPDRPRRANLPVPEVFDDGRYSVKGLARRMGVSQTVVRGWISRGLVAAERVPAERGQDAWRLTVGDDDRTRLAALPSHHTPRKAPLPDQLPDGRWSVPGLARRFGVQRGTVRGWIDRGVVTVAYEAYGDYPRAAWIPLDDAGIERLEQLASVRRVRDRSSPTTR
jgi:hypothetical protein